MVSARVIGMPSCNGVTQTTCQCRGVTRERSGIPAVELDQLPRNSGPMRLLGPDKNGRVRSADRRKNDCVCHSYRAVGTISNSATAPAGRALLLCHSLVSGRRPGLVLARCCCQDRSWPTATRFATETAAANVAPDRAPHWAVTPMRHCGFEIRFPKR
jgi:hypothetical protein